MRASEAGYAAVMVAIVVPLIGIGCAATAVDTGRWFVEVQRVQKAADAASLAGVPYLPQDLANARVRALEVAKRNGYDDATSAVTVTVEQGVRPTQLSVTIVSVIDNTFGAAIGVPHAVISRTGVADYQGPAPMGSPCNTFGNEPDAGAGSSSARPIGTAQSNPALANCPRKPQLWATVEAPGTDKIWGDRYQTLGCGAASGIDGCTGNSNDEYDPFGYAFVVRVSQSMVNAGSPVQLQLYDPMFVYTQMTCAGLPVSTTWTTSGNANPYVTNADARNRYSKDGSTSADFCNGDFFPTSTVAPMTTSFVLRQQTDSQNYRTAPVQNDTAGAPCIKQYGASVPSSSTAITNLLRQGTTTYDDQVASSFHNWTTLCSFRPASAGDYYLQVRTNVSLGGSGTGLIRSGNAAAAAATGNTTSGTGINSFAMRAVTASGLESQVAVSGYNHMPIFVNAPGASAPFNLIRVLPGAAGKKISFSYFDAGDAASDGSVKVSAPTDATGSITSNPFPGGCTAYGGSAGGSQSSQTTLTSCTAPFVQASSGVSKNNGKTETITIPIPTDYSCNYASQAGCWYRVTLAYGVSTVNDITTWDATVIGDPVRLVK